MLAGIDLGGSNTDVVIAGADGQVTGHATLPWSPVRDAAELAGVLLAAGADPNALTAVAITGGQHRALPRALPAGLARWTPAVVHVEEPAAIGRGALIAAGVDRAFVMSMGTGTALVAAGPEGCRHLGGTAIGGGTVMGLARLLLGTADPVRIGELAAAGDARAVDLSVGDIVGGPVGVIPAEMTASHFGKVGRAGPEAHFRAEDVAAGLLEFVGQALSRLGLLAARAQGYERVVLTGHLLDWPGILRAVHGVAGAFGGAIIVPPDPGLATARGALAVLRGVV